ncbi:hypothetical protein GCM10016234_34740 [Tianweitania populi]|uniref:Uncharacterized protein n=2 Tax=Tianweitania populi TaxID=1607949 RepID=A0A8J3E072_9HYPH|nr:hypothetical protein GCM10016234_34740 [Tianweitania populi]
MIDEVNRAHYEDEIVTIAHRLSVMDGLAIVDRNRVYVDTDAITRLMRQRLTQTFLRYRDLLRLDSEEIVAFDQLLKDVSLAAKHGKEGIQIPPNEADGVLLDMVSQIRDEFLHNPAYGLDFYLSKRIRHLSFVGKLRDPLELKNLITTRMNGHSGYNENSFWLEKLSLTESSRERLSLLFSDFAAEFDERVALIKDRLFHARSTDKPEGIFDIVITPSLLYVIKVISVNDTDVEKLFQTIYAVFWGSLSPHLELARTTISQSLRLALPESLNRLRAKVAEIVNQDAALQEFSLFVAQAISELETAIIETESWFDRADIKSAEHHFTLSQAVDVAVESALKSNKVLEPKIAYELDEDTSVFASQLVFITDAVLVAFGNIRKHSQLASPNVLIRCGLNSEKNGLQVEVIHDVSSRINKPEHQRRMSEIRDLISRGADGKRSKFDEGSGFIKLAQVVRQSEHGRIEFDFHESRKFRLFVQYAWIPEETTDETL